MDSGSFLVKIIGVFKADLFYEGIIRYKVGKEGIGKADEDIGILNWYTEQQQGGTADDTTRMRYKGKDIYGRLSGRCVWDGLLEGGVRWQMHGAAISGTSVKFLSRAVVLIFKWQNALLEGLIWKTSRIKIIIIKLVLISPLNSLIHNRGIFIGT